MLGTNCGTVALIVVCLLGVNIIHAPLYSMFVLYGKMCINTSKCTIRTKNCLTSVSFHTDFFNNRCITMKICNNAKMKVLNRISKFISLMPFLRMSMLRISECVLRCHAFFRTFCAVTTFHFLSYVRCLDIFFSVVSKRI